jgi:hypothetical protein
MSKALSKENLKSYRPNVILVDNQNPNIIHDKHIPNRNKHSNPENSVDYLKNLIDMRSGNKVAVHVNELKEQN